MYCVLSQNPIKCFFQSKNKTEYAYSSNYFSFKTNVKKKDIYDSLFGWVNWYAIFENKPLFLSVMTDNYWFRNIDESEDIRSSVLFANWGNIPSNELQINSNKFKNPLAIDSRLWNDSSYFESIYEVIKFNNFNKTEMIEIKLDGVSNELYRMG